MNRSIVKKLVWIDGRGVVLVMRSIRAKEQAKSESWYVQLSVLLQKFKINKQEPVS